MSLTLFPQMTSTAASPPDKQIAQQKASASRIAELAVSLEERLDVAIAGINNLNSETKFIAINAKMEATRAGGQSGKAFSVVAQAIQNVSYQTADVARRLSRETHETVQELRQINQILATTVLGERLSDLALNHIDLVDRNLYERTCDVRWWATDTSVVQACSEPSSTNLEFATRRLGQILDSYTVYFDIIICDLEGRVLANGRPRQFNSVGSCHADKTWFRTAVACTRGDQFGFRSVSSSNLVNNQRVLIYSCGVREGGVINGRLIGVIAIIFRWDALAQVVVENCPLYVAESERTRVCIVDQQGMILADTDRLFGLELNIPNRQEIFRGKKNHAPYQSDGKEFMVGHAFSPGFETYSTGWHSLVIQRTK